MSVLSRSSVLLALTICWVGMSPAVAQHMAWKKIANQGGHNAVKPCQQEKTSMKTAISLLVSLLCITISFPVYAMTIYHNRSTSANDDLNIALLKLIVSKADPTIQVQASKESYTDGRAMSELEEGNLSVIWTMTSVEHEQDMLPVRYCLMKGLLGYRVFIIRQGDQHRFSNVRTLDDLKKFRAGQGATWADTIILRDAGLPVTTTTKYKNLFPMLDGERFDYFPRGIFEPWSELPAWKQYPLAVEEEILLHYPAAIYFFVKKGNEHLAQILSTGFEKALLDGSYDAMLYASEPVMQAMQFSNMSSRRVIRIENPVLPPQTPLERAELWFDMEKALHVLKMQNQRLESHASSMN